MITKEKILKELAKPDFWTITGTVNEIHYGFDGVRRFDLKKLGLYAFNESGFDFLLDLEPLFEFLKISYKAEEGLLLYINDQEDQTVSEFATNCFHELWSVEEFEEMVIESAQKAMQQYWDEYIQYEHRMLITGKFRTLPRMIHKL